MIANHKGEIPVVVLLLPFLFGIGFGIDLLSTADARWLTWIFVSLGAAFMLLNLNYNRLKHFCHTKNIVRLANLKLIVYSKRF